MRYVIRLFVLLLFLNYTLSAQKRTFTINGKVQGIEDKTWLYLKDSNRDLVIDSTKVDDNSFKFESKIDSFPIRVILHSKNFKNYAFFWLEDEKLVFNASNSTFKEARITGNINQLDNQLKQSLKSKIRRERLMLEKQFVEDNPNSIISANILSVYKTTFNKNDVERLYLAFSEVNKSSAYGKSIMEFLSLNKGELKLGDKFIDFEMLDNNGGKRKFSEVKAEYILLEFWASNCAPCRKENPNLVKIYNTYKEKGFEIFAVSEDIKKSNWLNAIRKDKLPWINVSDLKKSNKAFMIYGINGIPDNFLIDSNGIIIARNLRGEKLNQKLNHLFSKK